MKRMFHQTLIPFRRHSRIVERCCCWSRNSGVQKKDSVNEKNSQLIGVEERPQKLWVICK
jgi:hypothetical protein